MAASCFAEARPRLLLASPLLQLQPRSRSSSVLPRPAKARRRTGEQALVVAIEEGQEEVASALLDGPEAMTLLAARSHRGCTPLMMAGMGYCSEALAERILAHGPAACGVALKSWKGKTAADYADVHRQRPGFVRRLRELEREELARTASERCAVCGIKLRRRTRLAEVLTRCQKGEEENELVVQFFRDYPTAAEKLLGPFFHTFHNDNSCRQRLSRSLAMVAALEQLAPDVASFHIVDLCCGKSLNSALVALRHPSALVTAIDRVPPERLPHYAEAGIRNVRYSRLDVLHADFLDTLAACCEAAQKPVALLGMHLCGRLSERAIEAFGRIDLARVCVLSPCCLPNLQDAPPALAPLYRTGDALRIRGLPNDDWDAIDDRQYDGWCQHLKHMFQNCSRNVAVDIDAVSGILSKKNAVITAVRQPAPVA